MTQIRGTELGHIGVWLGALASLPATREHEVAAEIEELGYGTLWYPESKDSLVHGALLLSATRRMTVASGIASIYARDATAMVAGADALADAYPNRFVLGIGASHRPLVAARGHDYAPPLPAMRAYLDGMNAARQQATLRPSKPVPFVLAALRPKMLELAAARSDGAHPYLVPVEHTRRAREILGPDKILAPELFVLLERDAATAREAAREPFAFNITLPNYRNNLRWLGFTDEDFEPHASDRLVDVLVAWGDEGSIAQRVRDHLDAGANHVCIQPIARDADPLGLEQLQRLAPALLSL